MANFDIAFAWLMQFEDPAYQYKDEADNNGAGVISGINGASYPADYARIKAIAQAERGPAVKDFYQQNFWNKWFDQIQSDEVAKRVVDAGTNMGPGTACKLAQEAAGAAPDGAWGPNTVSAINRCDAAQLVTSFKQDRLAVYQRIAAANPDSAKYLGTEEHPGPWWIRCMK